MDLRLVSYFLEVVERGSVSAASKALRVGQPSLSRQISKLEREMGVALFVRHARGVEPTWYGEVLVRHARNAISELQEAQQEIANLKAGTTGHASIAMGHFMARNIKTAR